MKVEFLDARLKKSCEDKATRQRLFQKAAADKLATRLDDLAAAATMEVVRHLPGSWEELTGDRKGRLSCRLGVASPAGWKAHYDQMQPQFRRARPLRQTDVAAITAWLRMGELQAGRLQTADYSAARLLAALPAMRAVSRQPADRIGPESVRLCADAGVALVFVSALPGTHVSGVARWLHGKPLIQLSLLGKWNDGFWFSFFHEVAHVLKHPMRAIFLDDAAAGDTVASPRRVHPPHG